MTLTEYIKQNYKNPNKQILKVLGASDALIEYLFKTPWNTNVNILNSLINESSGDAAVVGTAIVGTDVVG